jgi:hypothetical protein
VLVRMRDRFSRITPRFSRSLVLEIVCASFLSAQENNAILPLVARIEVSRPVDRKAYDFSRQKAGRHSY